MTTTRPIKIKVFSDFDGTLCYDDTGVLLVDDPRSLGPEKRKALDKAILDGHISYREGVKKMWDSVTLTLDEAWKDHLDHSKVDPGFPAFHKYCRDHGIPITVVSSGLYPLLEQLMIKFIGAEHAKEIDIISNNVIINGNKWDIQWHDDSDYGNDKSKVLEDARKTSDPDTIFVFCGDGISDISAAKHADVLFARKGRDLETHCGRNNIPFVSFDSFEDILTVVDRLANRTLRLEKGNNNGFCRLVDA